MIQVIEQLNPEVSREICQYLAHAPPGAGVCGEHDPRWLAVLEHSLQHKAILLLARKSASEEPAGSNGKQTSVKQSATHGGAICGYLPLALVASRLFGRFLVSLPYLNRAGVVSDDAGTANELIERACELAEEHDVEYLELRHGRPIEHPRLNARREEKVRMVLELPSDAESLWKKLDAKVRNQVRKGDKHNLSIRWGGRDLVEDFYNVFAVNMRDLGTPVYSKRLFVDIIEQFPSRAELAVVMQEQTPIACALLIHDPPASGLENLEAGQAGAAPNSGAPSRQTGGSTQVPSASSLREYNHTNANMWMYHQLLLRAMARGSKQFDFGRSSEDSGTYKFKKQWGAAPEPTVWQYHVRRGDINSMRPDNPSYRRRIEAWQKLPVWVTRLVGPSIVRGIP